jgi:hypothetical protein
MSDLPRYWPSSEDIRHDYPRATFTTPIGERATALAAHAHDGLAAISRTAAWLHGFDTLPPGANEFGWPLEFSTRHHAAAPDTDVVRTYRWAIPNSQLTKIGPITTTTLSRTLVDCARLLPRLEACAAADQLTRAGASITEARAIIAGQSWQSDHQRRAMEILDLADPRSESPMESWCRCMIIDAELPAPVPQVAVPLPDGSTAYLDLGFEQYRIAAEYDGHAYHSSREQVEHDRLRRAALARAGWRVCVFRAGAVLADPASMLHQLMYELGRSGWNPGPGQLARTNKRVNYIAMQRRLERERKFGVSH